MQRLMNACVLALALTLTACATTDVGNNFNDAALSQLQPGRTTLAQTVQLLGQQPLSSERTARGNVLHVWGHVTASTNGFTGTTSSAAKKVVLAYSPDGVFLGATQLTGVALSDYDRARLMPR